MILPPPLDSGARLAVVAPSGPFDSAKLEAGLAQLSRFLVEVPPGLGRARQGYLAGSDEQRLQELQLALDDPTLGAILIARGGFGLGRIIHQLDWDGVLAHPKWIVGFSDTTVLHAQLWSRGLASIHGPNGTTLAESSTEQLQALLRCLSEPEPQAFSLDPLCVGVAEGPILGGNLTVLFAEAAAGRLVIPQGAVLFLEDVAETSYRVDRMLCSLKAGGYFERCSGLIFGEFTDCSPGKFEVPIQEVLSEFSNSLKIPVASGLPVGHGSRNFPVILGGGATLQVTDQSARLSLRS